MTMASFSTFSLPGTPGKAPEKNAVRNNRGQEVTECRRAWVLIKVRGVMVQASESGSRIRALKGRDQRSWE